MKRTQLLIHGIQVICAGNAEVAVTCFSRVTFARMLSAFGGERIASTNVANMEIPVYKTVYHGYEICLFMSDVGAPACVGAMEEIYAMCGNGYHVWNLWGTR